LLIAALLLAHGTAVEAVPPVYLTTSSLSSSSFAATLLGAPFNVGGSAGNYDLSFNTPIADASALTSISGGSVSDPEGGSFQLSVHYTSGTWTQLLSQVIPHQEDYSFSSLSPTSFTLGTIDAIRFALDSRYQFLYLPQNTQFTFAVTPPITPAVPEPSSVLLMLTGGAAGLLSLRRRRKSAVPQLATSE
jgi:hypothetical protein